MKAQTVAPSLAVLFLVNVLNFYDRNALGAVTEPIRHEFHLSDTQIGALPTLFTVIYALAGLPLGRLADTWSRRRLLVIGVTAWTALTALGALSVSYWMLLLTRMGVGIGEAVCAPAATSWIGDVAPTGQRARAMAGFMMAVPVGTLLSFTITGPVAQAHGWRIALAVAALPAVALVPALLWLKEPERPKAPPSGRSTGIGILLKNPVFWWITASGAVVNFILYTFAAFLSAFLTRFHGLSVANAGLGTGIGLGASGILGAIAGGVFGDRVIHKRRNGRMLLCAAACACAAPASCAAILLPAGNAAPAMVLLMAANALLLTYYGLVYSTIQDIVPPNLRGTAMAVYFVVMYLCGASFGPLVTGSLSDHFAARAAQAAGSAVVTEAARAIGLHHAMYVIPVLSLVLAAVLWTGARAMLVRGNCQTTG